ncbi:uncharacterized protein LOC127102518 [Lathyrus oleraceus]|uniref:uncharacterized protein LOC127102518 n=1 Tax=Pisum sativum TaxID=3888 RepID=UPI0021CFB028|nr:uncharacterized protein LOC127102518 [Pisum sativum]
MVHPDIFLKQVVSLDVQGVIVKVVDVGNQFKNKQKFESHDQMLQWIRIKASKLGFGVVIRRFNNVSNKICVFVKMTYERSEKYRTPLRNFKRDDTGSRKCEYRFKALRGDKTEMQQLLKLLDDNSYVSRYRTCEDEVTVRGTFWTHPYSIKLFNMFPMVLILDSIHMINKYRLSLLEMVGATSIKKTYSVGFAFLECEKEDNFTWALEVCRTLLKDQGEIPTEIAIDRDTALMNLVAKVKEKIVCARTDNVRHILVSNIFRTGLNYIFHDAKRADNVGYDKAKCGCTIVKTYGLSCACFVSKKVKLGDPIKIDEFYTHWKRLGFDDDGVMNDGKSNISILTEWEVIQERFLKADDNMKLHIKEQLRKISYPETTNTKPSSQPIKTKGVAKKMKPTPNAN